MDLFYFRFLTGILVVLNRHHEVGCGCQVSEYREKKTKGSPLGTSL